jgi:hypothetical protein
MEVLRAYLEYHFQTVILLLIFPHTDIYRIIPLSEQFGDSYRRVVSFMIWELYSHG